MSHLPTRLVATTRHLQYVLPIGQAKTEETRQRRIEKAVSDLKAGKK